MRKLHAALAAVFMLASSAFAADMDASTQQFLNNTYSENQHTISMGKMAAEKATNADVKNFGQTMADDHTKMGAELQDLAQKMNFDLSKAPGADVLHKQHADKFAGASGAAWDRAFMEWSVESHNREVEAFENQIRTSKNADIVAFAGKHLPAIREHHKMARDLSDRISKGAMIAEPPLNGASEVSVETRPIYREVVYEQPATFVSYECDRCDPCEVKYEECDVCEPSQDVVYDNDYRALQTELKDFDEEGAR